MDEFPIQMQMHHIIQGMGYFMSDEDSIDDKVRRLRKSFSEDDISLAMKFAQNEVLRIAFRLHA